MLYFATKMILNNKEPILPQINGLPQTGYTCTHAVTSLQLQNTLAGHPRMQSDQAQLRGPSATILAAKVLDIKLLVPLFT